MRAIPCFFAAAVLTSALLTELSAHPDKKAGGQWGVVSLDVSADGATQHLLTTVVEKAGAAPVLHYLRSDDAGQSWSDSVVVGSGQPAPHGAGRGMDPQIAGRGDQLVASWMVSGTGMFGSGPIATAISGDRGKTWQAGPNPSDTGSTEGHGFMDLAASVEGRFHLVWLDSRQEKRGLRHASSDDGGISWSRNSSADDETCECCWNTLALWPDGSVAALYRDKAPRDMALVTRQVDAATWSAPVTVGGFGWEFEGCPHVGGGLALSQENGQRQIHAAVWTGQQDQAGVYYLQGRLSGSELAWAPPVLLESFPASHPDLAHHPSGALLAAWSRFADGSKRVAYRLQPASGEAFAAVTELSDAGTNASHPRVIATEKGFRVYWTEETADGGMRWNSQSIATQ